MNVDQLVAMKRKIEAAKIEKSRAEGALEELEGRLKTEFNLDSFEAAEEYLKALSSEITQLEKAIEEGVADLKDRYAL